MLIVLTPQELREAGIPTNDTTKLEGVTIDGEACYGIGIDSTPTNAGGLSATTRPKVLDSRTGERGPGASAFWAMVQVQSWQTFLRPEAEQRRALAKAEGKIKRAQTLLSQAATTQAALGVTPLAKASNIVADAATIAASIAAPAARPQA